MNYRWSESAGRYQPAPNINRRYLTNTGYLISLGCNEQEVTGEIATLDVSWGVRYQLLCPPAPIPVLNVKRLRCVKD
jgi:hypothetical protein